MEFDLSQAIGLTYAGLGAAFLALALLILFTQLARLVEHRRRRTQANDSADPAPVSSGGFANQYGVGPLVRDAELVAAIAAALALSVQSAELGDWLDAEAEPGRAGGQSWRGQGRLEAFDARRRWQRGR